MFVYVFINKSHYLVLHYSLTANSHMEIPFATNKDAVIAYNSLRIDKEPLRGNVIKELEVQDKLLIVNISANDPKKLRSAVSSFMDFLILVINTIEKFGLSPS
ncbi:EKC/KEOPS complex subunit Lage3 isoform X2 [Parasteatoda tepidariorum]|uniref:EKC/KEOPS complex subunit Lage3 isoform X2 n=1 Tax=Parasteatoda tepidariorum TaxID=114398 RepID=UPI001C7253F9|nr:uncharacterized protein LOC122270410 [Parasteatoda tepidariorum]